MKMIYLIFRIVTPQTLVWADYNLYIDMINVQVHFFLRSEILDHLYRYRQFCDGEGTRSARIKRLTFIKRTDKLFHISTICQSKI